MSHLLLCLAVNLLTRLNKNDLHETINNTCWLRTSSFLQRSSGLVEHRWLTRWRWLSESLTATLKIVHQPQTFFFGTRWFGWSFLYEWPSSHLFTEDQWSLFSEIWSTSSVTVHAQLFDSGAWVRDCQSWSGRNLLQKTHTFFRNYNDYCLGATPNGPNAGTSMI